VIAPASTRIAAIDILDHYSCSTKEFQPGAAMTQSGRVCEQQLRR
jgi:hypothetical protein